MHDSFAETWSRIQSFAIDEGEPAFPFAARLANENGWTRYDADRVVEEYKRFLFLMVAAGHPVTPSDQVDQAWHLHLTYTRSYWDRLCGETLGRPLHHGPTRGGQAEQEKFDAWYADTLASYERIFETPPPEDIWPEPKVRFGEDLEFRRVNIRRNWVVPRGSKLSRTIAASVLSAALIGMWNAAGVRPFVAQQIGGIGNHGASVLLMLLLAVGLIVVGLVWNFFRLRRCPQCRTSLAFHRTSKMNTISGKAKVEWRCAKCSYRAWRRKPRGQYGSDGVYVGCGAGDGGWFGDWFGGDGGGGDGGGGCGGGCGGGGCGS